MIRDIVVIGAPVGGAEATVQLVAGLPTDFEATVLIVLHTTPENPILLADVLNDRAGLRASVAFDGEPLTRRRIYVAADGQHLTLGHARLHLSTDDSVRPRPSIDRLFTSAATACQARVIGVLLLHGCEDGAAGLHAIRRAGGRTITHRNARMPESPTDRANGESLSDAHLALEQIAPRVLAYHHGGDG